MREQLREPGLAPAREAGCGETANQVDPTQVVTIAEASAGEGLFLDSEPADQTVIEKAQLDDLLKFQDYERKRLGQELHDAAGQLLTSLQFSIARLRHVTAKSDEGGLIDEIGEIVGQIDKEIRSLAFLQYPAELGDRGICCAVETLVKGFGRRTSIATKFRCIGDSRPVDAGVSLSLLRVTQEALTNIFRHSRAKSVKVDLEHRDNNLYLTISDDGVGIPHGEKGGFRGVGLESMRHRVEVLGGRFRIGTLKQGTRVSAVVPL